jgi:hypothetical protein
VKKLNHYNQHTCTINKHKTIKESKSTSYKNKTGITSISSIRNSLHGVYILSVLYMPHFRYKVNAFISICVNVYHICALYELCNIFISYIPAPKYFSISHHKINYLLKFIAKYQVLRDVVIKIKAPRQTSMQFRLNKRNSTK